MNLLLANQSESLANLYFYRYSLLEDYVFTNKDTVSHLRLPCLDAYLKGNWPIQLFTNYFESLKGLALGFDSLVARDYAHDKVWTEERLSYLKYVLSDTISFNFDWACIPQDPVVHLTDLALTGLDLLSAIRGDLHFVIDRCSLETLILHSCCALGEAFDFFKPADGRSKDVEGISRAFQNLQHLQIRYERSTTQLQLQFGAFLAFVPPLVSLQVLLEGCSEPQGLKSMLEFHGKTLRNLVWDERNKRRSKVEESTSIMPSDEENLMIIINDCPGLVSLGLSLNWQYIINSLENWRILRVRLKRVTQLPRADIA